MATTTPQDLIALAFRDSGVYGVGQTPLAEDTNDAFDRMNMMLAQWQRKRWLVYHLVSISCTMTGAAQYTVGTGGDFNVARPDRIESAFQRQLNVAGQQPDQPIRVIQSYEEFTRIPLKAMTGPADCVFYDSAYPTGSLKVWPVPAAGQYAIYIQVKEQLSQFTSLSQTISLPGEYKAALFYNLCARLRPAYGKQPDPSIVALARDSLNVIRGANAQIQTLQMPVGLPSVGGNYNIYSDR